MVNLCLFFLSSVLNININNLIRINIMNIQLEIIKLLCIIKLLTFIIISKISKITFKTVDSVRNLLSLRWKQILHLNIFCFWQKRKKVRLGKDQQGLTSQLYWHLDPCCTKNTLNIFTDKKDSNNTLEGPNHIQGRQD